MELTVVQHQLLCSICLSPSRGETTKDFRVLSFRSVKISL